MLLDRVRIYIDKVIKSRIGHETIFSLFLKSTSVGLSFLTTVLLVRILGPADYGIYSYVIAIVTLLTVPSEFGLPALIIRETASGMAREDYSAVQGVWVWSVRTAIIISLSLIGLSIIMILIFKESMAGGRLETFAWSLALIPFIALGDLRGAALRGLKRVVAGQLPEFLLRPGFFVLLLIGGMLWSTHSITAPLAMALYLVASVIAFGFGAWILWRVTPDLVRKAAPHVENRAWLLSAIPLALFGGMAIINQQASILLQGFYLPDTDIGFFRVALQVSHLASFGLLAVNMVVAPRFAALYSKNQMSQLQNLVTSSAGIILAFNLVVTIGFAVFGKYFLRKVFGISFEIAYIPMLILLGGQLVNSGVGSVALLLNMTNHERETAKVYLLAAVVNISVNLLLIPNWGIIGSSIAIVTSQIALNLILWWVVREKLHINSFAFSFRGRSS